MPMAAMNQVPPTQPPVGKSKENTRGDKQSESALSEKSSAQTFPPSEPFDMARPPPYPGQWMVPTGHPFYPYPMAPPAGFMAPPFPLPMMHPHAMATHHSNRAYTGNSERGAAEDASAHPVPMRGTLPVFAPPSHPPVSSIRPSEITKRHIDILRARLKYLEDQLSYNRHQIDERAVENDVQMVRQYIRQFEKNLAAQMSIEEAHFPKPTPRLDDKDCITGKDSEFSNPSISMPIEAQSSTVAVGAGDRDTPSNRAKDGTISRFDSGLNSTRSSSAFANWKEYVDSSVFPGQVKSQSTLPLGAAKAAPFQPRTECPSSSTESAKQEQTDKQNSGTTTSSSQSFSEPAGRIDSTNAGRGGHNHPNAPYLVGCHPVGVKSELATESDYTYGRPLTEDEQRARHMYWGKAPRHLQKGLPKFDGKDFFPPSPVKSRASARNTDSSSSVCRTSRDENETFQQRRKEHSDPFHGLGQAGQLLTRNGPGYSTQSESLPREQQASADDTATTTHSVPHDMRVGRSMDEMNRASQDTAATSSESVKEKSKSASGESGEGESEDDREIIFTGRKKMIRAG